ncbi:hypothetical protein RM697_03840 [Ichthyenterobacterium sp. W332]|uniref:Lipoprotein n=1 Tax=Microcosmobacter mediterraneus TaxID=3075607 RepID=A0ABU2YIY4_9FLAO|nr:hypothetical protein [Ichthyenterobacterium sp. W332]MDT0557762.1 hypothetical protein [Ichthyenterobacterium sp. W332]
MRIFKRLSYVSLCLFFVLSCDKDENEDGNGGEQNTVTFLDVTKEVIGGCTIQTTDPDLGVLCTFTIFYQLDDADVTVGATISGPCDQELNDTFIMSDSFFGDEIRFAASAIYSDGTFPDSYFGESGSVTLVNNDTETSMTFNGVVYNIASSVTETISGNAKCPL